MARAQELLAGTTAPISDIAYGCGFSSQAHMTTVSSNRIGTTPAKYRKTLQAYSVLP